jgi:tripartite-type tricarboxylate transporter receptor subunit TctC
LAKSKPDMLNFGSSRNGAPSHLAGEIQVMFAPIVAVLPQVKAGRLHALGVTTAKRSAATPELPTLAEAGLTGYEISS